MSNQKREKTSNTEYSSSRRGRCEEGGRGQLMNKARIQQQLQQQQQKQQPQRSCFSLTVKRMRRRDRTRNTIKKSVIHDIATRRYCYGNAVDVALQTGCQFVKFAVKWLKTINCVNEINPEMS